MDKLPKYITKFNKHIGIKPGVDPKTIPAGVTVTFDLAEAIMKAEKLGKNGTTDMLCVSISSTDAISHNTGTWFSPGKENEEVFLTLDRDLKKFFKALDAQVGKDGYLLFLTADHGGTHNPNTMKAHKLPGGYTDVKAEIDTVNVAMSKQFGVEGKYIHKVLDYSLYINRDFLSQNNLCYDKVKAAIINEFKKKSEIFPYVIDNENAAIAPVPQWIRERVVNGYYRGRTGDITLMVRPDYFSFKVKDDYFGAQHGSWSHADTHIPLVFMGWHIKPGKTHKLTYMVDTAPTVCALLNIEAPSASIGNPIVEVVDQK